MQTTSMLKLVTTALEDIKGQAIETLDVRQLTTITDYMVICTGRSDRQVKALAENVIIQAKNASMPPLSVTGLTEGEWVLIDLNAILVHIMQQDNREFYQLEKLWQPLTHTADNEN